MPALAQPSLPLVRDGHAINFKKSDVFCTKKCGVRIWRTLSPPLVHKISALDKDPRLRTSFMGSPLSKNVLYLRFYHHNKQTNKSDAWKPIQIKHIAWSFPVKSLIRFANRFRKLSCHRVSIVYWLTEIYNLVSAARTTLEPCL